MQKSGAHVSDISILAPARGATYSGITSQEGHYEFQSSLPQGERRVDEYIAKGATLFQSSLPQGERRDMYIK